MHTSRPQSEATPLSVPSSNEDLTIVQVGSERRLEAVSRLVLNADHPDPLQATQFLRFAEENQIDLGAMWARLDGHGRVQSTVLVVPSPGRTAMLFATPLRRPEQVDAHAELIDHVCEQVPTLSSPVREVQLAQVVLPLSDYLDRLAYRRAAFEPLATLSYLERPLPGSRLPASEDWPGDVSLSTYDPDHPEVLIDILARTYEDTLDCPGLLGRRQTADVLAGHLATGQFDPALWTLMHVEDRPAGALLLNPSSQGRCIELVYLGLAPPARGRGLGGMLLRYGLRLVRKRPERLMTLAVDEQNAPAMKLYRRERFRRIMRRAALIRSLHAS